MDCVRVMLKRGCLAWFSISKQGQKRALPCGRWGRTHVLVSYIVLLLDRSQAHIGLHIAMLCRSLIRTLGSIAGRLEVQSHHKYLGVLVLVIHQVRVSFRLAKFS